MIDSETLELRGVVTSLYSVLPGLTSYLSREQNESAIGIPARVQGYLKTYCRTCPANPVDHTPLPYLLLRLVGPSAYSLDGRNTGRAIRVGMVAGKWSSGAKDLETIKEAIIMVLWHIMDFIGPIKPMSKGGKRRLTNMSNIYMQELATKGKVVMKTTVGDVELELWAKETPKACRNFIQLSMEGS
ncbi:Peptidyl-prolyl cis-trans isomerase CWC27 like protein [Eufriesea mexicana]|nr:Peptidyl-prolyl cis-trans isomerase CWC27 like protein [Eufriesea mexicana]